MTKQLLCLRDAMAMGVIWGALWAAVGALIGIADRTRSLDALWVGPAIGMHPGFVGGVVFSALLGIAARPRRFDELSLSTAVAGGGTVGLVLGVLPLAINQPQGEPLWLVAAVVIGSMTFMSAVSAAGSLALARKARARKR